MKNIYFFFLVVFFVHLPNYGATIFMHDDRGDLTTFDTDTLTTTVVGNSGVGLMDGMAFVGSTLFGLQGNGNLFTINTTTGASSLVGSTGLTTEGLTSVGNKLYSVQGTTLFEINSSTAGVNAVQSVNLSYDGLTTVPVAVNTAIGVLGAGTIVGTQPSQTTATISAIDINNGTDTFITSVSINGVDETLAFAPDGTLFGHNFNRSSGTGGISTIDLTNGNHTFLSLTTGQVRSMAILDNSDVIPEPQSILLLVFALLGATFYFQKT